MAMPSSRMPLSLQLACGLSSRRGQEQSDFGFPEALTFQDYYTLYCRNSMARAVADRIPERCWESTPEIIEGDNVDDAHEKTAFESAIGELFSSLSMWERMKAADIRGRVGSYGALYLMFADGKDPSSKVEKGARLVKVQPLYEGQLKIASTDQDVTSIRYGQPVTYQYVPSIDYSKNSGASAAPTIHHSRIVVFAEGSDDGGVDGASALEPVYNDLLTHERIIGACGVGYWRSSRSGLTIKAPNDNPDIISGLATAWGCSPKEVADKLDEEVYGFLQGQNTSLMTGGLDVNQLQFSLPDPEPFAKIVRMSIAAGSKTPEPVLIGQQLSQKASDKNSEEFDRTCESRRAGFLTPVIRGVIDHLIDLECVPAAKYCVYWPELSSPGAEEKLSLASKMAAINASSSKELGEAPFTIDEIRSMSGYEPLEELDYEEGQDEPAAQTEEP